jgi:hypothetical protein
MTRSRPGSRCRPLEFGLSLDGTCAYLFSLIAPAFPGDEVIPEESCS